eukprot:sb/3477901/
MVSKNTNLIALVLEPFSCPTVWITKTFNGVSQNRGSLENSIRVKISYQKYIKLNSQPNPKLKSQTNPKLTYMMHKLYLASGALFQIPFSQRAAGRRVFGLYTLF